MNKFIKSTLVLLFGGMITKILAFVIRIYFTRVIKDGINIYSLVMPTYSLLVTICQLGFPIAISNIIAKGEKTGRKVIYSIVPFSIIFNIVLILICFISSKYLSNVLLKNPDTYYPLLAMSLVLPFISISAILRGYFFGKQQMMPHSISNIIEQLFKLFIVIIILPKLVKYGNIVMVSGYILISIISETISIIVFLLYLPKGFKIKKEEIKPDLCTIKEVLNISLPTTCSRIIGNIGYFLEPIILTNLLLINGYSINYITSKYAIYNTYTIGLLIVPTFLIGAISTSLLPEISKNIHNKVKVKAVYKKIIFFSLLLGIISNIFLYFTSPIILKILFKKAYGVSYIRFLCPFFTLYYLELPLITILQAFNENKFIIRNTIISIIIKLTSLAILCFTNIGIYSLIVSEIIDIIYVDFSLIKKIKKVLK